MISKVIVVAAGIIIWMAWEIYKAPILDDNGNEIKK